MMANPLTGREYSDRYHKLLKGRKMLPIFAAKERIQKLVQQYQTLLLVGETGSGKTTQVPQFILDMKPEHLIACTQPRRVAAISVSERVSEEMDVQLGEEVGYTIRFDDKSSPKTRLKYLTDGMLLREAMIDPLLQRYSVIILDEAHERTVSTDILIGTIKQLLPKRPDLRVIVMSATLEEKRFQTYFPEAPLVHISGRMFGVEVYHSRMPEANYVEAAIRTATQIHLYEGDGDILIFLTGEDEIETVVERLQNGIKMAEHSSSNCHHGPVAVFPLYSALPPSQQRLVFQSCPAGTRKIVVATNVAETSLTIDGVVFVIDCGFSKQKVFNPKLRVESLLVTPISQASARQRCGRAGRTKPGKCFRLYTMKSFETVLQPNTYPEILRCNLGSIVLHMKKIGIDDLVNFDFVEPPAPETLMRALELLNYLGALDDDGNLTTAGGHMSEFPVDPEMAAMLYHSAEYGCSDDITRICAMLSVQNPFINPSNDQRGRAVRCREQFYHTTGDHVALLNVFNSFYEDHHQDGSWCTQNYINPRVMKQATNIFKQLLRILQRLGIPICSTYTAQQRLHSSDEEAMHKLEFANDIRRAIVRGFFTKTAISLPTKHQFQTLKDDVKCLLFPTTYLNRRPKIVVFNELVLTSNTYIRTVTAVSEDWLLEAHPEYFAIEEFEGISRQIFEEIHRRRLRESKLRQKRPRDSDNPHPPHIYIICDAPHYCIKQPKGTHFTLVLDSMSRILMVIVAMALLGCTVCEVSAQSTEAEFKAMKVKDLRAFLEERGLSCVGCQEKSDFVRVAYQNRDKKPSGRAEVRRPPAMKLWEAWSANAKNICIEEVSKRGSDPTESPFSSVCETVSQAVDAFFMQHGKRIANRLKKKPEHMLKTSYKDVYYDAGIVYLKRLANKCLVSSSEKCESLGYVMNLMESGSTDFNTWLTNTFNSKPLGSINYLFMSFAFYIKSSIIVGRESTEHNNHHTTATDAQTAEPLDKLQSIILKSLLQLHRITIDDKRSVGFFYRLYFSCDDDDNDRLFLQAPKHEKQQAVIYLTDFYLSPRLASLTLKNSSDEVGDSGEVEALASRKCFREVSLSSGRAAIGEEDDDDNLGLELEYVPLSNHLTAEKNTPHRRNRIFAVNTGEDFCDDEALKLPSDTDHLNDHEEYLAWRQRQISQEKHDRKLTTQNFDSNASPWKALSLGHVRYVDSSRSPYLVAFFFWAHRRLLLTSVSKIFPRFLYTLFVAIVSTEIEKKNHRIIADDFFFPVKMTFPSSLLSKSNRRLLRRLEELKQELLEKKYKCDDNKETVALLKSNLKHIQQEIGTTQHAVSNAVSQQDTTLSALKQLQMEEEGELRREQQLKKQLQNLKDAASRYEALAQLRKETLEVTLKESLALEEKVKDAIAEKEGLREREEAAQVDRSSRSVWLRLQEAHQEVQRSELAVGEATAEHHQVMAELNALQLALQATVKDEKETLSIMESVNNESHELDQIIGENAQVMQQLQEEYTTKSRIKKQLEENLCSTHKEHNRLTKLSTSTRQHFDQMIASTRSIIEELMSQTQLLMGMKRARRRNKRRRREVMNTFHNIAAQCQDYLEVLEDLRQYRSQLENSMKRAQDTEVPSVRRLEEAEKSLQKRLNSVDSRCLHLQDRINNAVYAFSVEGETAERLSSRILTLQNQRDEQQQALNYLQQELRIVEENEQRVEYASDQCSHELRHAMRASTEKLSHATNTMRQKIMFLEDKLAGEVERRRNLRKRITDAKAILRRVIKSALSSKESASKALEEHRLLDGEVTVMEKELAKLRSLAETKRGELAASGATHDALTVAATALAENRCQVAEATELLRGELLVQEGHTEAEHRALITTLHLEQRSLSVLQDEQRRLHKQRELTMTRYKESMERLSRLSHTNSSGTIALDESATPEEIHARFLLRQSCEREELLAYGNSLDHRIVKLSDEIEKLRKMLAALHASAVYSLPKKSNTEFCQESSTALLKLAEHSREQVSLLQEELQHHVQRLLEMEFRRREANQQLKEQKKTLSSLKTLRQQKRLELSKASDVARKTSAYFPPHLALLLLYLVCSRIRCFHNTTHNITCQWTKNDKQWSIAMKKLYYQQLKLASPKTCGLVVHFSAGWCEPCAIINSFLMSKAAQFSGKVTFAEVDGDAHPDICELEGVDRVPLVLFFRMSDTGMEPVADVSGAQLDNIECNLNSLYGPQREDYATLNDYLKCLTTRPGVVLFITGTPSRPRCGFTSKLCETIEELKVSYLFYDVMGNDEVCEGLKKYAEWPTYPQVYVDGELIGGWDICKQLQDQGELKSTLKAN
eukprot:gene5532-3990_t